MRASIVAIEDVYRRRYRAFLRVALAYEGNADSARDSVQEAFARAIARRRSFSGKGTVEAWLWRTLVNVCLDARRRARRRDLLGDPVPVGEDEQDWPELRAAVAALPERQRLVLFLRHYADLDYDAIAAALGISRGTVAATLHSAHTSLRRTMTEVLR